MVCAYRCLINLRLNYTTYQATHALSPKINTSPKCRATFHISQDQAPCAKPRRSLLSALRVKTLTECWHIWIPYIIPTGSMWDISHKAENIYKKCKFCCQLLRVIAQVSKRIECQATSRFVYKCEGGCHAWKLAHWHNPFVELLSQASTVKIDSCPGVSQRLICVEHPNEIKRMHYTWILYVCLQKHSNLCMQNKGVINIVGLKQ